MNRTVILFTMKFCMKYGILKCFSIFVSMVFSFPPSVIYMYIFKGKYLFFRKEKQPVLKKILH